MHVTKINYSLYLEGGLANFKIQGPEEVMPPFKLCSINQHLYIVLIILVTFVFQVVSMCS